MRFLAIALLAGLLICVLSPLVAHADWHQASGEHFVVYADQSQKKTRQYAEKLERYDAALSSLIGGAGVAPSPSNRVSVFVLNNNREVRDAYGENASRSLLGFYQARAGGSIAFVPRTTRAAKSEARKREQILLHEYAHHFMAKHNQRVLPRWYSEGFAEFFSTVRFKKDGSVGLGLISALRWPELTSLNNVPLQQIFDTRLYLKNKSERYDNFYGRSWFLYHYLYFSAERRGQIRDYIDRLQKGEPELEAARASFGSLDALDSDLKRYMRIPKMKSIVVPVEQLKVKPVVVRKLGDGEAAMIPIIMRSKRGVNLQQAKHLLPQARAVAKAYPQSPLVLAALAEVEVDAKNYTRAMTAANAALAIDANNIDAHMQKGFAMARMASSLTDVQEQRSAWKAVRRQFVKANRLETENPLPLVHFYQSYVREGVEPTQNAIQGLEWALSLAPFDKQVRAIAARQQMKEQRYADARVTLVPLAYDPHQDPDNAFLVLLKLAEQKMAARL